MDSIDYSSAGDNSDDEYIGMDNIEDIQDGNHVHKNINARYARLKICDLIRQAEVEWKGVELSAKGMGKVLHKVFKVVVK